MERHTTSASARLALLVLASGTSLFGQAAPKDSTPPPATTEGDDAIIELSPFNVTAEEDKGYRATSTLAGTRLKTDLRDVGSAISVVTSQFLQDTGAKNNQDLLKYTTATEVGGLQGNFTGTGYGGGVDDSGTLLRPNSNTRVRGLAAADNTRDFFLSEIPWDGYNVGRVDIQRGPNSILFGLGSPAGIINSATNQATFKDANKVEWTTSQYRSNRGTLDINKVLLKDELAVRVNALTEKRHWRQKPTYQDDKRIFGALKFVPKFLNKNGNRTELRLNAESGSVSANRPHVLPPNDRITPWFDPAKLNKLTVNVEGAWNEVKPYLDSAGAGTYTNTGTVNPLAAQYPDYKGYAQSGSPFWQPWLGGFGNALGGPFVTFNGPNATSQGAVSLAPELVTRFGIDSTGKTDGSIEFFGFARPLGVISYGSWAFATQRPGYRTGDYKDFSITDRTIFDYYNQSIDGPNKKEWQNWDSYNANLSQTFLNNRIGLEGAIDHQRYNDGQLIWANQGINIDLNKTLIDGSANPNVGRAFIQGDPNWGNAEEFIERNSSRATAFGEFRGSDVFEKESFFSKLIGRHVFTTLVAKDEHKVERREYVRYAYDQGYAERIGLTRLGDNARQPNVVAYLTGDLSNRSSASGLFIQAPTTMMIPQSGAIRYFDAHYKFGIAPAPNTPVPGNWKVGTGGPLAVAAEDPANYIGWTTYNAKVLSVDNGDASQLTKNGYKQKDVVSSKAFVWQGFLWDGTVVPVFGYRKDISKTQRVQAQQTGVAESVNLTDPSYSLPLVPARVEGINRTYSLVVHTPRELRKYLPGDTNISLYYNKSSNFKADSSRVDVVGNAIGAPSGETKDYGIVISTWTDRVALKVNKFETTVTNESVPVDDIYKLGAVEAWGSQFAGYYRDDYGQDWQYNWANGSWWDGFGTDTAGNAARDAAKAAAVAAWYNPQNYAGDAFYKAWGIKNDSPTAYRNGLSSQAPAGLTATGNVKSEGYEMELNVQPTKNWSIAANAAKVTAKRFNVGGALAEWVEKRNPVYTGPAGDIRLWWAGSNYRVRDVWTEFYSKYNLLKAQENSSAPELRPWRFNVVSTYNFSEGRLKGVYVGGSYRWQSAPIIGYNLKKIAGVDPKDVADYDLNSPIRGESDDGIDLWFGYGRKLPFYDKVLWRIQLNIRDAFTSPSLVPIAVNPDGKVAHYRIKDGTSWALTNTFEF